jgi:sugar/nucleoside kinase (ribokinase family)
MSKAIRITGAGCCLVDQIYPDMDFKDPGILAYLSRTRSDGGLYPGRLVFSEEFEFFSGKDLSSVVEQLTENSPGPAYNVGGPSVVALIHAAQLLHEIDAEVNFYGSRGQDSSGVFLQSKLEQTPLNISHLSISRGATPTTIVLSDPTYHDGQGERMFINDLGAARNFSPEHLADSFFESDLAVFGGTALVPNLHEGLSDLLKQAKSSGCLTVVNTVYDFRSELLHPGKAWMLGRDRESYRYMDLLIADCEEAQHLSGLNDLRDAGRFFLDQGVSAYIITNGGDDISCGCQGDLFSSPSRESYPVSEAIVRDLQNRRTGDTTGCGDNFVGGVLASLAWQLSEGKEVFDLEDCICWATVSGGLACFHLGGTFIESEAGQKLNSLRPYYDQYVQQICNTPGHLEE